jgi:hypothetical protein
MTAAGIRIRESYTIITPAGLEKEIQILKGLNLALTAIEESVVLIEDLYFQALKGAMESEETRPRIKKQVRWIKRIIKKVRLKRFYPLRGDVFSVNFSGGKKIEIRLAKLILPAPLLRRVQANPSSLADALNEYKQKLLYNFEVIYAAKLLEESNNSQSGELPGQEKPAAPILQKLLALARRYCIRLSSCLIPDYTQEKYYELFVVFWWQIRELIAKSPHFLKTREADDILNLDLKLKTNDNRQDKSKILNALGSLLNEVLDQPFSLNHGQYAYG